MKAVRVVTLLSALVMAGAIVYGFVSGDFGDEGGMLLDLAWGRVTLIDLYVGLVLFGGWILLRERSAAAIPWLLALVVLGNLAAAVYAFRASMRADSVGVFLLGRSSRA